MSSRVSRARKSAKSPVPNVKKPRISRGKSGPPTSRPGPLPPPVVVATIEGKPPTSRPFKVDRSAVESLAQRVDRALADLEAVKANLLALYPAA